MAGERIDTITKALRRFPEGNNFGRQALVRLVKGVNWRKSDVIATLRDELRACVNTALLACIDLANLHNRSLETIVRNLIACADESELSAYSILLRYENDLIDPDKKKLFKDILW